MYSWRVSVPGWRAGGAWSCGAQPLACKTWYYPWGRECQNRVEFLDTVLVLGTVYWRAPPAPPPRPCWNWIQKPVYLACPSCRGMAGPTHRQQ